MRLSARVAGVGAIMLLAAGFFAVTHAEQKPNLSIQSFVVTGTDPVPGKPDTFYAGAKITFTATVANDDVRDISETFQNALSWDMQHGPGVKPEFKPMGAPVPMTNLLKSTSRQAAFTVGPFLSGFFQYRVEVDQKDKDNKDAVKESNENDNESVALFTVIERSSGSGPAISATKIPAGVTPVEYAVGKGSVTLFWDSWGSGDGAKEFRECVVQGVDLTENKSVGRSPLLKGPEEGWKVDVSDGREYHFWIECLTKSSGAKGEDGKPLTVRDDLYVRVAAAAKPVPGSPAPPLSQPKYREL